MSKKKNIVVPGFKFGAVKAGVKYKGRLDVGLILSDKPCQVAGVFTKNQVVAPSVVISKKRVNNGIAQAVLVNSGNANTCVGKRGLDDVKECTKSLAQITGLSVTNILMNSTGVIGEPLPANKIILSLPFLIQNARPGGLADFSKAIITTDTRPKLFSRTLEFGKKKVTIAATAKGAGMIMPNMATMLVYILTDADITGPIKSMLTAAVDDTFNALTIDGDTSTSDTVLLIASGASGVKISGKGANSNKFQAALNDICRELTEMIATDGEGATKMFKIVAEGAKTKAEADKIARRVANSPLVKTAFHAGDPNWGRIMMAVGSAGVNLDQNKIDVSFESKKGKEISVVKNGAISATYSENQAEKILSGTDFTVRINLGRGKAARTIYTCDFSAEYVKINAEYRT
jgi:glutamate N-acetyltransferase / amino-acid N-acetyltransferase